MFLTTCNYPTLFSATRTPSNFPEVWRISVLLKREIWSNLGFINILSLEGVPDLPVAPQDEAGLTKTFQTWPRGWFHIP